MAFFRLTHTCISSIDQVEGLPEGSKPRLQLQLSNPIEEGTLSEIFDPLNNDPAPEGAVVIFKGVETALATLTVTASDADIPLGSSAPHDIAPLCVLDAMDVKEQYVTELPVAISSETSEPKEGEGSVEVELNPIQPTCTVTLRITYKPSPKDQKEELYELLNKTSKRKGTALENLRQISVKMTRAANEPSPARRSNTLTKPSVKPGFLNKKKKEPTTMEKLKDRVIGPNSLLMKSWRVVSIGKNYFIFLGAISFFHFKGQMLALPPPA